MRRLIFAVLVVKKTSALEIVRLHGLNAAVKISGSPCSAPSTDIYPSEELVSSSSRSIFNAAYLFVRSLNLAGTKNSEGNHHWFDAVVPPFSGTLNRDPNNLSNAANEADKNSEHSRSSSAASLE
jgi:hypothetical protein